MLELLYTSPNTYTVGSIAPESVYIASWDAVLYYDYHASYNLAKVFKDGTEFILGRKPSLVACFLSAEGGRGAVAMYGGGEINFALLDEISSAPFLDNYLNGVDFSGKYQSGSFIDHLGSLVYTPTHGSILVYSLATGALVRTLAIAGFPMEFTAALHYGGASSLFAAGDYYWGPGDVAMIDRLTGEVTFVGKIAADYRAVTYDSVHHVVLALTSTGNVKVYALHNVGYALSAPSFSPSPALYTLSQVTTRLTDADGFGVTGKGVLWWLSGDKGNLEDPVTLTDGDGYARNWYYGPGGTYGLGAETVNVEVAL